MVGSNIVIGLYVLDTWSVLFVMYVGGMFVLCDIHMWLLASNVAIIVRTVCSGHVVSVVCSVYGCWDLI